MDRGTDERLAKLAAQGDERAFAILYARYSHRLHAYCRSILKNEDDAHDALQSSMLKAFRALRGNGGPSRCARGCSASPTTSPSR